MARRRPFDPDSKDEKPHSTWNVKNEKRFRSERADPDDKPGFYGKKISDEEKARIAEVIAKRTKVRQHETR